jgi:hypothetical protein
MCKNLMNEDKEKPFTRFKAILPVVKMQGRTIVSIGYIIYIDDCCDFNHFPYF